MAVTAGFLARTLGGIMRARTFTDGSNIAITNPTGSSGDPVFTFTPTLVVNSTTTGTSNAYAPGIIGYTVVEWNGGSDLTINGISNVPNSYLVIKNRSAGHVIYLSQLSGSAAAADQLSNLATSGATPVAEGGWAHYFHDGSNWKLVAHNQGAWITVPYSGGNFTGNGAMTWTVESADVEAQTYCVIGKTINYVVNIKTSTVGGTPNSELRASLPLTYTAVGSQLVIVHSADVSAAVSAASLGGPVAAAAYVRFFVDFNGSNWTADTNGTYVRGSFTFELT